MSKLPVRPIGKYGGLRMTYLKEHRPALYHSLVVSLELDKHLMDINEDATRRRDLMQQQMLKADPGPDKASDMMGWIQHQNNILAAIDEIIFDELIYT